MNKSKEPKILVPKPPVLAKAGIGSGVFGCLEFEGGPGVVVVVAGLGIATPVRA